MCKLIYNDVAHKDMRISLILQVTSYKICSFVPLLFVSVLFIPVNLKMQCHFYNGTCRFTLLGERASKVNFCRTFIPFSVFIELVGLNVAQILTTFTWKFKESPCLHCSAGDTS